MQGVRCEPRAAYLAANSSRLSPSSCSRLRCSAAAAHKFVVLMAGWRAGPSPPAPLSVAVVSGSILVVHSGQARVPLAEEPRRLPSCSFERRVTRERRDHQRSLMGDLSENATRGDFLTLPTCSYSWLAVMVAGLSIPLDHRDRSSLSLSM